MQILLVTNPSAGSSGDQDPAELQVRLERAGSVTRFEAPGPEELKAQLPSAARDVDLVAVAGGDGSLNLVINALEGQLEEANFLLLPGGTGNDLARTLGLPDTALESAHLALSGKRRPLDVWTAEWAGGRHLFVNASMGGFTVEVNKAVDEDLKKKIGPLAFWVGGVKAAKDLTRFTATVNGRKFEECVALGVGSGKTCGGGIEVWPEADPGDGLLDVCILPAASLLEAAKLTAKVRKGDHDDLEAVEAFTAAEVIVEADPAIEMNLDGELVDLCTPVSFRLRGQTHFMVP